MKLSPTVASMLVFFLAACRFLPFNSAAPKAGGEKPQTLFDQLIALAPHQQVPYPFAELLTYLARYGQPVAVLVPLGHSQLRQAAYPEPFKDPRRIVGFAAPEVNEADTQKLYLDLFQKLGLPQLKVGEFTIDSRLFLAYTQKTQQIEVMSLMPDGVAFDYQVVKNYGAGGDPFLARADEKQCRSCHQHDAPLTQTGLGSGSNVTPVIARLIAQHHPTGVLDGIPIMLSKKDTEAEEQEESDTAGIVSRLFVMAMTAVMSFEDRFKHFREQAITALNDNRLWHDGCLKPADNMACRKLLLQREFSCHFMGLSQDTVVSLPHCPAETELKVRTLHEPSARNDAWANYIDNQPEVRQGFALSAAGKRVLAKIKAVKLGDLDPRSIDKAEPGLYGLITIFLEAAGGDVDFHLPLAVPPLSGEDLHVIQAEVERLFMHVHRKDLHLDTPVDPMHKPAVTATTQRDLKNFSITKEVAKIFVQQTLLPANKTQRDIEFSRVYNFLRIKFDATTAILQESPHLSFDLPHDETLAIEFNPTTTATCRAIKDTKRCEFKQIALDTANCKSCKDTRLDLTLHLRQDPRAKPPVSSVTLQLNGKRYRFELLCSKYQPTPHYTDDGYLCSAHDTWQIGQAFEQLVADSHSAFHSDYFNPPALIRDMLKNLGYEEPLADN